MAAVAGPASQALPWLGPAATQAPPAPATPALGEPSVAGASMAFRQVFGSPCRLCAAAPHGDDRAWNECQPCDSALLIRSPSLVPLVSNLHLDLFRSSAQTQLVRTLVRVLCSLPGQHPFHAGQCSSDRRVAGRCRRSAFRYPQFRPRAITFGRSSRVESIVHLELI